MEWCGEKPLVPEKFDISYLNIVSSPQFGMNGQARKLEICLSRRQTGKTVQGK